MYCVVSCQLKSPSIYPADSLQLARASVSVVWTSVETNIRIIRIFEYFFPNNTIRIRIRPILKSRIIFEYSNKCSEYSEYFFRVFTGKNQNEKCKNGRLQQPKWKNEISNAILKNFATHFFNILSEILSILLKIFEYSNNLKLFEYF